jgi:general secretion pathway protein B
MADAPADVRLLALEARLADPRAAAPPAQARPRGGSVEVRDLLGPGTDAGAGGQPRKPGSVEVRDLLAEQGAQPVEQEGGAPAVVSDADGEVRAPSAARPAAAPRGSAPPPGAALPPHATPPAPQPQRDVPSLDDLVASGQLNPPDISLDMHAYGPVAEARFVYINMRRYHIGDTTREGAVVEDITPDGVVLLLQGRRFELSAR